MPNKKTLLYGVAILILAASVNQAQQLQVGGIVPASSLGQANAIAKPVLATQGGTLILSDSPEEILAGVTTPGAFYRDRVSGIFRVFYHHQNTTENDLSVGLAITNTSRETEILLSHGKGAGVNLYPDVAGQTALAAFLSSHNTVGFATILKPGDSYYSTQDDASGDTASGFEEYLLISTESPAASSLIPAALFEALTDEFLANMNRTDVAPHFPSGFAAGTGTVTTLVYSGTRPPVPTGLPILPPDDHIRGTFQHFDRFGAFPIAASAGLQALAVDTAAPGLPYSDDMPGEYELGIDSVDSGQEVYNNGNYGVLYKFHIEINNETPFSTSPMGILMQPTGGAGVYVMSVNDHPMLSGYVDYTSAWWIDEITSRKSCAILNLETSLPGGSAGPQQLLFAPGYKGQ
jgi:hypothetical protein